MKYKGYTAIVTVDEDEGLLFGRVIGLRDVITFQAETVPQAIEEFHATIDFYLETCAKRGESPEKPYSGNFLVRVDPELHRQIAIAAEASEVSINSLIVDAVRETLLGHAPGSSDTSKKQREPEPSRPAKAPKGGKRSRGGAREKGR